MWIVPTLDELKNSPTGTALHERVRPSVGGIQVIMVDVIQVFVVPSFQMMGCPPNRINSTSTILASGDSDSGSEVQASPL